MYRTGGAEPGGGGGGGGVLPTNLNTELKNNFFLNVFSAKAGLQCMYVAVYVQTHKDGES